MLGFRGLEPFQQEVKGCGWAVAVLIAFSAAGPSSERPWTLSGSFSSACGTRRPAQWPGKKHHAKSQFVYHIGMYQYVYLALSLPLLYKYLYLYLYLYMYICI